MTSKLHGVGPGDTIGYHPVGEDDVRQVGVVKSVDATARRFVVTMPDDPGIEEKVPFDRVEAVEDREGVGE